MVIQNVTLLAIIHVTLLLAVPAVVSGFSFTCNRIYFHHPSEYEFYPVHLFNAVYVFHSFGNAGLIYKDERGKIYFTAKQFVHKKEYYFAYQSSHYVNRIGSLIIRPIKWYRNFGQQYEYTYTHSGNTVKRHLTVECVDHDFTDCSDKNLLFKSSDKYHSVEYTFTPISGRMRQNRRVYEDRFNRVMLHYSAEGSWRIDSMDGTRKFAVASTAIKPEYVTQRWSQYIHENRADITNHLSVKLECQGENVNKSCSKYRCKNGGVCHWNSRNQRFCTCPYEYHGKFCQFRRYHGCPISPGVNIINNNIGAIRNVDCPYGHLLPYRPMMCRQSGNGLAMWQSMNSCGPIIKTSPKPSWQNNANKIDVDKKKGLSVSLKILAIIIPIIVVALRSLVLYLRAETKKDVHNVLRAFSRDAYIALLICIIYIIIYLATHLRSYGSGTFDFILVVAIALIVPCYILVLIESLYFAKETKLCCVQMNRNIADAYLRGLKEKAPQVTIHMECFHVVTDSGAKVKTWSGTEHFQFQFWQDRSEEPTRKLPSVNDASTSILRIKLHKNIRIADLTTKQTFDAIKDTVVLSNKDRDDHYKWFVDDAIQGGMKDELLVYNRLEPVPWWLSKTAYIVATVSLLAWPYRTYLRKSAKEISLNINKFISNSPFAGNEAADDGVMFSEPNPEVGLGHPEDCPPSYEFAIRDNGKPPEYESLDLCVIPNTRI